MTPEEMKFYLDVLASPAVVTFTGGLLGAVVTLVATWSKNRHDSIENEKTWLRQEECRREERAFEKKTVAYENFFKCFEDIQDNNIIDFYGKFAPVAMNLMMYGPLEVKKHTKKTHEKMLELIKSPPKNLEDSIEFKELRYHCNEIHTEIMRDMDLYFSRDDIERWEKSLQNTENKEMNSD